MVAIYENTFPLVIKNTLLVCNAGECNIISQFIIKAKIGEYINNLSIMLLGSVFIA